MPCAVEQLISLVDCSAHMNVVLDIYSYPLCGATPYVAYKTLPAASGLHASAVLLQYVLQRSMHECTQVHCCVHACLRKRD